MVTLNYTTRRVMASSGGPPGQMQAINISATSARTSARARAPTTSPTGTSSRGPGWAAASTGPATRPSPTATCWTAAGSAGGGTASSSSPSPTARGTRPSTAGAPGRGAGPRSTPCPTTQSSLQTGIQIINDHIWISSHGFETSMKTPQSVKQLFVAAKVAL